MVLVLQLGGLLFAPVSLLKSKMLTKILLVVVCVLELLPSYLACPAICRCVGDTADCSRKGLITFPTGLRDNIKELNLSFNRFNRIPKELAKLKNLTRLDLSVNKIAVIDYGDFDGITRIEHLDLSRNMLHDSREIKFSQFANLRFLKRLDLSHNSIRKLTTLTSQSLEILFVNNCSLMVLDLQIILDKIPNLTELRASNNSQVSNITKAYSKWLQTLDLNYCNLKAIHIQTFANLTNLQHLYIRGNKILKKFHANCPSLKLLDLSSCNLDSIPTGDLNGVIVANFHGNHFRSVNDYAFKDFSSLEQLDLSYNAISSVEDRAFYNLGGLKELDLSFNTLTELGPEMFKDNKKLKALKLSHNYFTNMVELESESITDLDVSACEISVMTPLSLLGIPSLKFLNLSRNLISSVPNGLEGDNLYKLDLSLCHIKAINNKTLINLSSLRRLNLSGNRLTFVTPSYFPQVFYLLIDDNPWRCDCESLHRMYEWFQNSGQTTQHLVCQSPEKVEDLTWIQACGAVWETKGVKKDNIWWYSVALIGTMVFILVTVSLIRKIHKRKEKRLREQEAQRRTEERETLRRMHRQQQEAREEAERNAPDPRELQRPPSYHEALLLPRLDASHPSLSGSLHSLASRQSTHASNPDVSKKARVRRKRRRKADLLEGQRASRVVVDSDSSSEAAAAATDADRPQRPRPQPLQSDF